MGYVALVSKGQLGPRTDVSIVLLLGYGFLG